MCFSATASFAAGITVGGIGLATLRLVPDPRERPFAALPLIFAVHQIIEGVVWTQVEQSGPTSVRTPAVELWLLIAWVLLPVYVPLAVRHFEPDPARRRWMLVLCGVGAAIGTFMAVESVVNQATASVALHHLQYAIPVHPGWPLALPYVAATCLPLVLSSHRFVVVFGVLMTVSMAFTAAADSMAFSSVWCFFAALLSVTLFVHYAKVPFPTRRTRPADV
jgi:hypothetical protein